MNIAFNRNQDGSVAVVFAFCAVVLTLCIGVAVDFGRARALQSKLQQAADAAALAAASDPYYASSQATQLALAYLAANTTKLGSSPQLSASVSRTASNVSVTVNASLPTSFMRLAGNTDMALKTTSVANIDAGEHEVYAALDMSGSLGIAATPQARADLEALTKPYTNPSKPDAPNGCHFACHSREGWEPAGKTSYDMAKAAGITLREDVLNSAFASFIDAFMPATDPAVTANRRRVAVIGFSDNAQLLSSPTNDGASAKAAPALFPVSKRWNTSYNASLSEIQNLLGTQGTGFNGSPKKTLLLITDGVGWVWGSTDPATKGPIDTTLCDKIRANGFALAVVEVKYVATPGDINFDYNVAPFYNGISPALQACASPGLYFLATDSDAQTLGASFSAMGNALKANLRITR